MRRDTYQEEVLSGSRRELRYYHHHAEGQFQEFQHSQAEPRQHLERSSAEGVQLRNLRPETRIANASIAPLQAREAALHQQSLDEATPRDGVTDTVADSPTGECSAQ